ncbi:MAG: hypothetical protein A3A80_02380 [Candidatus Terrybacteria bacterium RIFCSPLOWO2_01_FULL_44_24]|uniref:Zinc finger DksA/TraR C4-type domain-containing protein n=1 Tax=Candidatus Terrybacteria bacterium RIFCSPHIGHO2_01_FULL_43_35 TaxID=1802361 RepID=A0A1G2PED2_9BACT|nr:MAG: hypothetical protein A2828_02170 [Candidatus Terrybacteria bacterium RIFCSPHIGHO2_01_FULL_43_35]OHA50926.1 MAG: hypothetical protein A3A80_02380 [Candidatus Terrybacteria bacterium RIFCSPLOWO2_01_FULL_44_24]
MPLAKQDIENFKNKLLSEERRISETLASFATKNKGGSGEFTSRFPNFGDGQDEDAQVSAVEEYGTRLSAETILEERLRAIRRALTRIQKNAYGKCLNCKKDIPIKRLNASPEAELCGNCK